MSPSAPRGTMTMFGRVWPGATLTLEASGCGCPAGQIVKKLGVDALVPVTLSATDPAPESGTPPRPATFRLTGLPPVKGPVAWNRPSTVAPVGRDSMIRAGLRPVK